MCPSCMEKCHLSVGIALTETNIEGLLQNSAELLAVFSLSRDLDNLFYLIKLAICDLIWCLSQIPKTNWF